MRRANLHPKWTMLAVLGLLALGTCSASFGQAPAAAPAVAPAAPAAPPAVAPAAPAAAPAPPNQILIEMIIFEIRYENFTDLGIKYDWMPSPGEGRFGRSIIDLPVLLGTDLQTPGTSRVALEGDGTGSLSVRAINSKYGELQMTFQALIKSQKAKILSQPRILTAEGSDALIRTAERIPYLVKGSTSAGFTYSYQEEKAGLEVKVKAEGYNKENGFITLTLNPKVQVHTRDITIDNLKMPVIEERSANVTLRIPSGAIYAIGGLFRDMDDEAWEGIPILSSIPWAGHLFRNLHKKKVRSELVIFVTPWIIGLEESYSPAISQPSKFGEWKGTTPMPEAPH